MKNNDIFNKLDLMIDNPHCELNYSKDYELLIATVLSAQCTDKRVNIVTKDLFKYDLKGISDASFEDIERIIHSLGSSYKKAKYIKDIAKRLLLDYNGTVPNNREYLESLPGVGRKTCNVVLAELFNIPTIAVDTHVTRVSKRLGFAKENDDVLVIERKLGKLIDKNNYNKVNHQLILFGRYICTSKNPKCKDCLIKCKYKKKTN